MYKFRINFSGLIGCVPHSKGGQMMLLMVDGRDPHRAAGGEVLFPHFPFIHYSLYDLDPKSHRQPELTGRGYGVNFLSLEDLTIGDQRGDNLTYEYTDYYPQTEPDHHGKNVDDGTGKISSYGSKDLCWILPIHKVAGNAAPAHLEVADECLAENYQVTEKANKVVARLRLRTGDFYVNDFHTKSAGGEYLNTICRFLDKEENGTLHREQVVATSSIYELDGGSALKITSKSFKRSDGAVPDPFPYLAFQDPNVLKRDVVINIWNAPFKDLLDLLGGKHEWKTPEGDRSFRSYFRLCKKPPAALPVLVKEKYSVAKVQSAYGLNTKDVGCPKCLFQKAEFPIAEKVEEHSSAAPYAEVAPNPAAPSPST